MDNVTICADNVEIECPRSLLIMQSHYFRAMFSSNMTECFTNTITLKQVDVDSLRTLITYCKNEHLEITEHNAMPLLETACMLQFPTVITLCTNYLINNLTASKCLSAMCFAQLHGIESLYQAATKFSLWYAKKIFKSQEMLLLNSEQLHSYLNHDEMNEVDEIDVYNAVKYWIQHDFSNREVHFEDLFQCIRVKFLNTEQLDILMCDELVKKSQICMESLQNANSEASKKAEYIPKSRHINKAMWLLPLLRTDSNVVDDNRVSDNCGIDNHIYCLDLIEKNSDRKPVPWIGLSNGPAGYRACVIDCIMYVFGGEISLGKNRWLRDVWRYCIIKNRWSVVTQIPEPRRHHSLAVDGDNVYLIGGFGNYRVMLNSVYKYSISKDCWDQLPDLPEAVFCAASTVHKHKLYVIKHNIHCLNITSQSEQWTQITIPFPFEVGLFNAISSGDKIYLTAQYSNSVYEWDPDKKDMKTKGEFRSEKKWACLQEHWDKETGKLSHRIVAAGDEIVESFELETAEIKYDNKIPHCLKSEQHVVMVPDFPEFKLKK